MSGLMDALAVEPFSVNQRLIEALLLEPDMSEVYVVNSGAGTGSGTIGDPYVAATESVFDTLLNSLPANTTIHLGPGTFVTKGHADGSSAWQAKPGWRIMGAGMM